MSFLNFIAKSVRNLTRHPLGKLLLIKFSIYCEFLMILGFFLPGVMLSLVSLCPAVFLGNLPLKMEFFEHVLIQSRATFEYQKCA
jgi:hypothetical protein